jgi:rhodanese-related sulfurtransferase
MNARLKISVILLILGIFLAFMPLSGKYSLHRKPEILLKSLLDETSSFSADQVARFVITEDSTIQLIDLRSQAEFDSFSIPGSINIPYAQLLEYDLESYLNREKIRNIFYGNGDFHANYALVLARGLGYDNCYVMRGGLNLWYQSIMNSRFTGETISARENALYETRLKARKLFSDMNSMPDSMKVNYMKSKAIERKRLDGGCE